MYVPVFGGWMEGPELEEPEVSFAYARACAEAAEEAGLAQLWVPDHLLNPIKGPRKPALEAWTTLAGLAAVTSQIRLAHTTLCQAFRPPAVLAKMGATLDDLSGGRFELALGAGWYREEFHAFGLPWEAHGVRIARAREQLELIRRLWTEDRVTFRGRFYRTRNTHLSPRPIQRPHPPLWYAGESPESEAVVADLAEGWLISETSPDGVAKKLRRIEKRTTRCLSIAVPAQVVAGRTRAEVDQRLRRLTRNRKRVADWLRKNGLVGTPEAIVERLEAYRASGANQVILKFGATARELAEFAQLVLPQLP